MLQLKIISTFNMYRIPFLTASFGICLTYFYRSRKSIFVRLMPLMSLGTFASMYHYHIGQYGIYKNVDILFKVLTDKPDSDVGKDAVNFLAALKEQEESVLSSKLAAKKQRLAEEEAEREALSQLTKEEGETKPKRKWFQGI